MSTTDETLPRSRERSPFLDDHADTNNDVIASPKPAIDVTFDDSNEPVSDSHLAANTSETVNISDSNASSTFITNPHIDDTRLERKNITEESNYTFNSDTNSHNSMDESLASLQQSLANLLPFINEKQASLPFASDKHTSPINLFGERNRLGIYNTILEDKSENEDAEILTHDSVDSELQSRLNEKSPTPAPGGSRKELFPLKLTESTKLNHDYYSKASQVIFGLPRSEGRQLKGLLTVTESLISPENAIHTSSVHNSSFHNSTIDSTRDDTKEQLGDDIDIDDSSKERIALEKMKVKISPWKRLRAPSNMDKPPLAIPKLNANGSAYMNNRNILTASLKPEANNSLNSLRIDELNKEVTGYKIQIKFFKQFLQNLIDQQGNSPDLNIDELAKVRDNFEGFSPSKPLVKKPTNDEYNKLETDYQSLSQNYDEIYKLNEDLYTNLEFFQKQLQDKDIQLQYCNKNQMNCSSITHEIINTLLNDPSTSESSREALIGCLDNEFLPNEPSKPLDFKLHVISIELNERIQNQGLPKSEKHAAVIKDLMQLVSRLQTEFTGSKNEMAKIEDDLRREIEESNTIKKNYAIMYSKFNLLCQLIEQQKLTDNNQDEIHKLRAENERLAKFNQVVDSKFLEYQKIIDRLQKEVNDFREQSRRESINDESKLGQITSSTQIMDRSNDNHEEVYLLHKEFNSLQNDFNELTEKYNKAREDSSRTISSLTQQLQNKQSQVSQYKADEHVLDKLRQELDLSIEKERILKAEKIRLTYKIDSLTSDKTNLQATIQSLADKVTSLTVSGELPRDNGSEESLLKKANIAEYQFEELLQFDVQKFEKLLKSFNKIADDSSLKEPTRKIEALMRSLSTDMTSDSSNTRDYHKSIFNYFTRAVDIIVNDHVKLLLKENDTHMKNTEYINKLHHRIDELNNTVDGLSKQLDSFEMDNGKHADPYDSEASTINNTVSSPRSKMRIDELTNRWKAEREARIYEGKQAQRRLKELEEENHRLRKLTE